MSELSVEFELDVAVVFFGLGLRGLVLSFEMIRADRLITRWVTFSGVLWRRDRPTGTTSCLTPIYRRLPCCRVPSKSRECHWRRSWSHYCSVGSASSQMPFAVPSLTRPCVFLLEKHLNSAWIIPDSFSRQTKIKIHLGLVVKKLTFFCITVPLATGLVISWTWWAVLWCLWWEGELKMWTLEENNYDSKMINSMSRFRSSDKTNFTTGLVWEVGITMKGQLHGTDISSYISQSRGDKTLLSSLHVDLSQDWIYNVGSLFHLLLLT